jgi:hypothetical protein
MKQLKWTLFVLAALLVALPLVLLGTLLEYALNTATAVSAFREYRVYTPYVLYGYGALALCLYARYGFGIANALVPVRSPSSTASARHFISSESVSPSARESSDHANPTYR